MFDFCIPHRDLPERPNFLENFLARLSLVEGDFNTHIGGQNQEGKFNRAAALNEAIEMADGPWIATCDTDLILPINFLNLIKPMMQEDLIIYFLFVESGEQRFPGTPGGLNVFHKNLWETVGGYNEDYVGYGYEDYDFREKVIKNGFKHLYTDIVIEHIPHIQVEDIYDDLERNQLVYERTWKNED